MFIHEDDRRKLIEWSGGAVSKALIAKQNCIVGDHYHRNKEERFLLLSGTVLDVIIGEDCLGMFDGPREFTVPANTYHRFHLSKGAILLGVCTGLFDPDDEIKGHP